MLIQNLRLNNWLNCTFVIKIDKTLSYFRKYKSLSYLLLNSQSYIYRIIRYMKSSGLQVQNDKMIFSN